MYRILRNTFLTSRTGLTAKNTSSLEEEDTPDSDQGIHHLTPERLLLQQESHQAITDALERLPVGYREIILLCEIEELSYREIADVLAVPIGTVMSRLSRARKLLRQILMTNLTKTAERSPNAL